VEGGRLWAADATGRVRERLTRRRDPVRRHERRKRWTRRSFAARCIATAGLAWLTMHVDPTPGIDLGEVFWGSTTVVVGAGAVGTGRRLWQLEHNPPVAPPRTAPPPPLPPAGSAARRPLQRLAERERVLADLLAHLGPAADDPRLVAAGAAAALRAHGARVAAVEAARHGAAPASRAGLDAALAVLTHQLDDGVAGYDELVAAAADAVAASATLQAGDPMLAQRLAEATDALAGLAQGLREVTGN